jgi:multidrug efflux system membrane fusion protein
MKLRGSHLVALAILAAVGGWMFTGQLILGGQADPNAKTIVEREAERTQEAFRVRVAEIQPSQRVETLTVRGRTQSDAIVSVRAETGGTVETRLVKKGDFVEAGDLLCEIDKGVREVQLTQAQTLLEQTTADYEASEKLVKRGFATSSRLRSLKAAMDSAKFSVATAKQEMKRTEVRASVSGQVQSPLAEVGDNLAAGGVCVTLIDTDPMLFSGQLPEREISSVKVGMDATVTLISGAEVDGKIRFISRVADPNTRTFTIEIEMPNKDKSIRDGLTAEASIGLSPTDAYQLKPSWLTLEDDGAVGVRVVDSENKVRFVPLKIIAQEDDRGWVEGLTAGMRIITLGQNFVAAGQTVEAVTAAQMKELEKAKQDKNKQGKAAEVNS